MILEIITVLAGIAIAVLVYLQDTEDGKNRLSKKTKKRVILSIAVLTILSSIASSINNKISDDAQEREYSKLRSTYNDIKLNLEQSKSSLDSLDIQNDSLKLQLSLLRVDNQKLSEQIISNQAQTINELKLNRGSIYQLGKLAGARTISHDKIQSAIDILSKTKSKVLFTLKVNDSETTNFTELLKEIFKTAGWETYKSNGFRMSSGGRGPLIGLKILFIKDDVSVTQIEMLQRAMETMKIQFKIIPVDKGHKDGIEGAFHIFVGAK